MKLKPRHRWFASTDVEAIEGWWGPCKTIEAAVNDCIDGDLADTSFPIYVAQGYNLTKQEREDWCDDDVTWQVDTREYLEIRIVKNKDR